MDVKNGVQSKVEKKKESEYGYFSNCNLKKDRKNSTSLIREKKNLKIYMHIYLYIHTFSIRVMIKFQSNFLFN